MKSGIVNLLGIELLTAKDENSGIVYVAMKPIISGMGIDWTRQSAKIREDQRYGHMYIPYQTAGGTQEMLSLATDHLPAFLYSINPNKVRKDLRDNIIAFQNETFAAINAYWREKSSNDESVDYRTINAYKMNLENYRRRVAELESKLSLLPPPKKDYSELTEKHFEEFTAMFERAEEAWNKKGFSEHYLVVQSRFFAQAAKTYKLLLLHSDHKGIIEMLNKETEKARDYMQKYYDMREKVKHAMKGIAEVKDMYYRMEVALT